MNIKEKLSLKVNKREVVGKQVGQLRRQGFVPAVMYGGDAKPENLQVNYKEFARIYKKAGGSILVELEIEGNGTQNTLIQQVDINPKTREYIHADFRAVSMSEKITAHIPLVFVGESPAVEDQDGTLVKNIDEIEIECLPGDLPSEIEIDISVLVDFEASIHLKDIKMPTGVELLSDPEETVASVEEPRSEEELAELDEAPVEDVEAVVGAEEKEGEEGAEGEAKEVGEKAEDGHGGLLGEEGKKEGGEEKKE